MIRAESDLHVAAPPEEVFDRLVDMRNELHWNPMVIEMEKSTDGEVTSGTRFDGKMKRAGRMHMVVTDYERPRRFRMSGGGKPADVSFSATFEPGDGGGTRIRTDFRLEPKGITRLFSPLMARQAPKQEAEAMESFKRWVESL